MPKNLGASGARNAGAKYAENSIIAFNDSDDLWKPEKLEKQMNYWQEHPEFAMIYCEYQMHRPEKTYMIPDPELSGDLEGDIFPWLLLRNSIGTPTMLMYRDCFLEVGGFDVTLRSLEDWDFAIRFAEKFQIGYVEEPLVDAQYSEGGVSSAVGVYYESRCKMIAAYKEQMLACGVFDAVVNDLFRRAQNRDMLETVKKMLMLLLAQE